MRWLPGVGMKLQPPAGAEFAAVGRASDAGVLARLLGDEGVSGAVNGTRCRWRSGRAPTTCIAPSIVAETAQTECPLAPGPKWCHISIFVSKSNLYTTRRFRQNFGTNEWVGNKQAHPS